MHCSSSFALPHWSGHSPRVGQATVYELLNKEHEKLQNLLKRVLSVSGKSARETLHQIEQEIEPHEDFEEHVLYPLLRKHLGMKHATLMQAFEEHAEIRMLLKQLSVLNPGTKDWRNLAAKLEKCVIQHVKDEESGVFPAARDAIDDQTALILGRQYEQMKDIAVFVPTLLEETLRIIPASLVGALEISIENICATPEISTGAVDLSLVVNDRQLYNHVDILSCVISHILQALTKRGLDASLVLSHNQKEPCVASVAFIASPNPEYVFVQKDFDPACPRDFDPARSIGSSLQGAQAIRVGELIHVLRDITRTDRQPPRRPLQKEYCPVYFQKDGIESSQNEDARRGVDPMARIRPLLVGGYFLFVAGIIGALLSADNPIRGTLLALVAITGTVLLKGWREKANEIELGA